MAIEQGLTELIAAAIDGTTPPVAGGFMATLPKDWIASAVPMAWTYRGINGKPEYTLAGPEGFVAWNIQIDCHGLKASHAITLAALIDTLLSGYHGTLSEGTVVQGIFNQGPGLDGYNDVSRTYVRTLEYQINYQQS